MKRRSLVALPLALAAAVWAPTADAAPRSLADYRHFRALTIDLAGRIPTRGELAAFEKDGFDLDAWTSSLLLGPGYVNRMRQIYMDLLRIRVGAGFQFWPQPSRLHRFTVIGPNGKNMYIYYRPWQRRTNAKTDGDFCLTPLQTGYQTQPVDPHQPYAAVPPHPVLQADLDANTVVVKPWWLYADYKSPSPTDLYGPSWATTHPGFVPASCAATFQGPGCEDLVTEPDGTPTTSIRICKEETQGADLGTIYAPAHPPQTFPDGRNFPLPSDSEYATAHKGEAVPCSMDVGGLYAADCGCGVGLERCLPGTSNAPDPVAFAFTFHQPIGLDQPTFPVMQLGGSWEELWWNEETARFFGYILGEDRDFREVLTGRYSLVNGPLEQFYRAAANNTCCSDAAYLGYTKPEPLFDPTVLPGLNPVDVATWKVVDDRGPHAAGILTMPAFLTKFGTRRARAHVLHDTFMCEDFVAGNIQLKPSIEPNLTIRSGCSTCHATLEPLAAYFSRVQENDWTYLPEAALPVINPACQGDPDGGAVDSHCAKYYDPAFTDGKRGTLRGAYPDTFSNGSYGPLVTHHADDGPAGLAQALVTDPAFPGCVAQNVASAMLGRTLTQADAALRQQLTAQFVKSGYKMSALVKTLVTSSEYRASNNLTRVPPATETRQ